MGKFKKLTTCLLTAGMLTLGAQDVKGRVSPEELPPLPPEIIGWETIREGVQRQGT